MLHVGVQAESFADLALLLDPVALGDLVNVFYREGRVGVVGEEDLDADLCVGLLEDVAGDEELGAGEDGEAVLEAISSEFGQLWQGLKVGEVGIQGVFLRQRNLLFRHQLLPLLLVGGELRKFAARVFAWTKVLALLPFLHGLRLVVLWCLGRGKLIRRPRLRLLVEVILSDRVISCLLLLWLGLVLMHN